MLLIVQRLSYNIYLHKVELTVVISEYFFMQNIKVTVCILCQYNFYNKKIVKLNRVKVLLLQDFWVYKIACQLISC